MTEFKINEKFEEIMKKEVSEMTKEERKFYRSNLLEISRYSDRKRDFHWNDGIYETIERYKQTGVLPKSYIH